MLKKDVEWVFEGFRASYGISYKVTDYRLKEAEISVDGRTDVVFWDLHMTSEYFKANLKKTIDRLASYVVKHPETGLYFDGEAFKGDRVARAKVFVGSRLFLGSRFQLIWGFTPVFERKYGES
jgi:hypothetical protein